ncbi:MAG: hypothetical protein JW723_08805 [Bacteroidales bacterium]|nr:hypothetical protein [Bacteroidales bacterium]
MMKNKELRIITLLSLLLAISLAVASVFGIFVWATYERETASMAAQGIGQDIVNLFLVVPLLVVSLLLLRKNNIIAFYVFGGTVFYILYSFIIYCFGVHFNMMFLVYCATLGLSVFIFIILLIEAGKLDVQNWFHDNLPVKAVGIFLLFISLMFYILWLKDVVPAIISNTVPASVSDYNLLVNPVHVIDISFALPGLIVTAALFMNKKNLGYILAPISLVFIFILAIALAIMVVMMKIRGIGDDTSIAAIFIIMAAVSLIFLFLFMKALKKYQY